MTQNDLDRAVAHSTRESVREISRRGFVPLEDLGRDDESPIDWDEAEVLGNINLIPQRKRPAFAS